MLLLLLLLALASGTMQSIAVNRERLLLHLKKAAAAAPVARKEPATFTQVKKISDKQPKTLFKGRVVAAAAAAARGARHVATASSVKRSMKAASASGHLNPGQSQSKHASVPRHPKKQGKAGPEYLKQEEKKKALARTESRYFGKYKYF